MASFETIRFGTLEYREEDVIRLRDGLIGMPALRRWLVLEMGEEVPLKWLQSLERSDFGFPVTDPYYFRDDFEAFLPKNVRRRFGLADDAELAIMIVTTIHSGGTKVTGNLLAPLIVSTDSREGAQLPLDERKLSVREEIDYFKFGLAAQGTSSENGPVESDGTPESTEPAETADTSEASEVSEESEPAAELHEVNAP